METEVSFQCICVHVRLGVNNVKVGESDSSEIPCTERVTHLKKNECTAEALSPRTPTFSFRSPTTISAEKDPSTVDRTMISVARVVSLGLR